MVGSSGEDSYGKAVRNAIENLKTLQTWSPRWGIETQKPKKKMFLNMVRFHVLALTLTKSIPNLLCIREFVHAHVWV